MIRAVLDANVVVAAMLNPAGRPAEVVGRVRVDFELVWSPPIVTECHRVADYRKIRSRVRVADPHGFIDDLADADGAPAEEYAREVDRVIKDFADHERPRQLAAARRVANAEQRAALRRLPKREWRG